MGRVERQTIQVAIESVYDLHMHAGLCVVLTTGRMYGGTSLVCRRWCDYSNMAQASCAVGGVITVTKKSDSASYTSSIRITRKKNKAVGINVHLTHPRLYATTVSTLGPGFRT